MWSVLFLVSILFQERPCDCDRVEVNQATLSCGDITRLREILCCLSVYSVQCGYLILMSEPRKRLTPLSSIIFIDDTQWLGDNRQCGIPSNWWPVEFRSMRCRWNTGNWVADGIQIN